ncbi:PxKF domain-containing protein [Cellulomonas aerilata]|uniref:Uncharacterized protein n=1 Tax=Cellulomonas aerilata TaxID=515326 RepID=A0A512D832_9CELL|nr:PxKF domain-containing protein [Cellulomonas aerilata]GEO32644.1 hypothetical protein CAE01nite_03690 [Cellulomonas aerilata]
MTVISLLGVTAGGAAYADDIYNTIDGITAATAIDTEAEVMPLASGGNDGTTTLRVQARNSDIDGFEGCNMNKGPVTFSIQSSNPAVATVEPTSVQFTACTPLKGPVQEKTLTVKPVGAGSATITATVVVNPSPGSFNTVPATFRVDVAPPPNSPPTVTVVNVDSGAHYVKGTDVPTPMCKVVDAEDGTFQFAPAMSRPAPQLPDGLGERVAKCTYTDTRGATAVSSASYFIEDGDAPVVRYILSEPAPANGWYRHEIALDWVVTEPQSPGTLTTEGCERVWVTADQDLTDYTCTATSAGGTTSKTSEKIRKDATAPVVTGTIESPSVEVGDVRWYPAAPSIRWDVSDAVSGVLEGSVKESVTVSGEGRNKMARTVATDNAGNTGGGSVQYINIDASAPVVEAALTSTPASVVNGKAWFKDEAKIQVTATDPEVQPSERGSGLADDPTGEQTVTATGDFTATATDHVGNTGTSNTIPVAVDSAAPSVGVTCPKLPLIKNTSLLKATWTASDEAAGSGLATPAGGSFVLDTKTVGHRTATAPTASDRVGHTSAAATCGYQVVYPFLGFLGPVDNFGVYNKVKAGSAVPMKFSLVGNQGLDVLKGAPVVTKVTCPGGMKVDELEETASSRTAAGLTYDSKSGLYQYTWKTASTLAGTCQKVTFNLADGTSPSALFSFTR